MGEAEYEEALKLGRKEYKACVSGGRFPYLPVLDAILSREEVQTEQTIGLINIPLEYVVGTSTRGRTYSFAANFMPILGPGTEFATKWASLSDAQVNEGIRDPIKAYEYRNRYYVVEGNKRVSVLKYFKADSIDAVVTRKIPKYSEDEDIRIYYEYMKFNELTGIFSIDFSKLGMAETLLELTGGDKERWDEDKKITFVSLMRRFRRAYEFRGGRKLPITVGDAFGAFLNVYGYEKVLAMSEDKLSSNVLKCWNEFVVLSQKKGVELVMDPVLKQEKKNLLGYLLPAMSKKLTVAFLYPRSPEVSDWIYGHELGRNYLEETFPDKIRTIYTCNVNSDNIEEALVDVIHQGADIVFELGPQMMPPSLKIAIDYPEVKILNCSLNAPHKYIRTYYARMYEAKFLSGMIAGSLAENDRVGYIADYPIYGLIANINAFALGVACTNPRAKVYLEWSTKRDYDKERFLGEHDIQIVSDQDMITPRDAGRKFGLYRWENNEAQNLVMPLWNWGIFYEKMIQSILAGTYQTQEQQQSQAINYWWGMSAGVVDLICSKNVPASVRKLAEHLKGDLKKGDIVPFYGEIYSQDGTLRNPENETMSPNDIMEMDYLVDNVIGSIPTMESLVDAVKSLVQLKGVEEAK